MRTVRPSQPRRRSMNADVRLDPAACDALTAYGHVCLRDAFAPALVDALIDDCRAAEATGTLRPASIGRAGSQHARPDVRGDSTLWLERADDHPARGRLLDALDALRVQINRTLLLGLESVEAHYAVYPPGARYARHRDRFRDDDARVLSMTLYLNPDWHADDGGELRLWLPDGPLDVAPHAGTCCLFLSDEIEHEVLPARRARYSIAGWFRRRT